MYDIPSTVHVLDLAYVLPLMLATGLLLFRLHAAAQVLAALLLVKMVTLGLALRFMLGSSKPTPAALTWPTRSSGPPSPPSAPPG